MIIRSLALRHGRKALAKPASLAWKRALASQVQSGAVPYDTSFDDQQHVEGGIGGDKAAAVLNLESRRNPTGLANDEVAREYHEFQAHKKLTNEFGSSLAPFYQPHTLLTNPPKPSDITLELLMASQSHLGHATSLWNPANSRYIFGVREGIHIISLDVTASHLRRACTVVRSVTERGGLVLFVGTRKGQDRAVVKAAEMAGGCHLFDRWIPGSITNGQQILGNCRVKVVDELDREIRGFEEQLANKGALKPDLVVCLNPLENYILLHECGLNNIPTIGVIDTDANPTHVTYPIPANDDSLRCIQVIAGVLGRAGQEGQRNRLEMSRSGRVLHRQIHGLSSPTGPISRQTQAEEQLALSQPQDQDNSASNSSSQPEVSDSELIRLIAAKRQEMGETMTAEEKKLLKDAAGSKSQENVTVPAAEAEDEPEMDEAEVEEVDVLEDEEQGSEDIFAQMERSMPTPKTEVQPPSATMEPESLPQGEKEAESTRAATEDVAEMMQGRTADEPASATQEPESLGQADGKKK